MSCIPSLIGDTSAVMYLLMDKKLTSSTVSVLNSDVVIRVGKVFPTSSISEYPQIPVNLYGNPSVLLAPYIIQPFFSRTVSSIISSMSLMHS